jgi:[acyl-carrier-protein] S-malonyltransferase
VSGFALLCPGQGDLHAGMLAWALADAAVADTLRIEGGRLAGADWTGRVAASGAPAHDHRLAQMAIVAAGAGAWARLRPVLPDPDLIAGYSLGELTAWTCAGAWSLAEALALAATRADAMSAAAPGAWAMAAVRGVSPGARDRMLDGFEGVHVAIVLDADHVVLTGRPDAMSALRARAEAAGAGWTPLAVPLPSHSPPMHEAAIAFGRVLRAQPRARPRVPVVRGVDGRLLDDAEAIPAALEASLERTIRWDEAIGTLRERGVSVCLELPPGRALSRMIDARGLGIEARAVEDFRSPEGLARWVADRL